MATDSRIGTEFAGYRIQRLLGRGGMGVVYVAEHLRLNRQVALKLLAPEIAQDPKFRERFVTWGSAGQARAHLNVPKADQGELLELLAPMKGDIVEVDSPEVGTALPETYQHASPLS